jgi:adhesin/invasin
VTVNGIAAPLYYASSTQIDFQMPSGVPAADVNVVVTNSALTRQAFGVRASVPRTFRLSNVEPGLFITTNGRAAALNVDLSPNTPTNPVPAGGYILLFIVGQGPVTPAVADGTAAPLSALSIINGRLQVFIGGVSAQVTDQGLAPGFAGLAQINAIVPSGLVHGDQPVFVTIDGVSSNTGAITVQ